MNFTTDEYVKHSGENLWDFEVLDGCDFINVNHIHPLKQRDIAALTRILSYDIHILEAIVFGSSVRFDCNSASDLDVLVVRDDDKMRIDAPLDEVCSEIDVIFASHLGNRLRDEIARTGVPVYRR